MLPEIKVTTGKYGYNVLRRGRRTPDLMAFGLTPDEALGVVASFIFVEKHRPHPVLQSLQTHQARRRKWRKK